MRRIRMGFLLLAVLLLAAACGEDPDTDGGGGGKASGGDAVGTTTHTLALWLPFDLAVKEGRLEAGADRRQVREQTMAVVRDRLRTAGLTASVEPRGDERFVVSWAEQGGFDADRVIRLATALGTLEFLIEVLPAPAYGMLPDSESPPRLKRVETIPWRGTATEFETLKEAEAELWIHAHETSVAYRPSDPRYVLVPRHGTDAVSPEDFALLEVPKEPRYRFDGGMLENPRISSDPGSGRPVVLFSVKRAFRDAFHAFTRANRGLRLAIVLDGTYRSAPTIQSALSGSVQIMLGPGTHDEMRREAETLATVLSSGALKVRPRLEKILRSED